LGVSILVFAFLHLVPGDPVDHLAGGEATAEQRKKIEVCMGLDLSAPRQFARFLGHIVDGTLGHQCPDPKGKPTVAARIAEVFPHTLALAIAGMLVAVVLALPLGVIAAIRRGTWVDTLATVSSLSVIGLPMMLLAPVLLLVFFIWLGWLPGPTETGPASLLLPAVAVGLHLMAMLARMTRSSMIEVLSEDYVRTARAKGLPERRVLVGHALRNALLPVITIAGLQFGSLLTGTIVVEKVFARPGLGLTLLDAIFERNYPVVQGCVLVIAVIYVFVNIAVDLAYGLADPRIRRA
jgi:peptide/nickel transport system permease protein